MTGEKCTTEGTTLHYWSADDITSTKALQNYLDKVKAFPVYILTYSPRKCRLGLIKKGQSSPHDEKGEPIHLDDVYELRAFCENAELRWLHDSGGKGHAVILSENKTYFSSEEQSWKQEDQKCNLEAEYQSSDPTVRSRWKRGNQKCNLEAHCLEYLIWGESSPDRAKGEWSAMYEPRIGLLHIPVPGLAANQRAALKVREYIGEADSDRNMAVVEERLMTFQVYTS